MQTEEDKPVGLIASTSLTDIYHQRASASGHVTFYWFFFLFISFFSFFSIIPQFDIRTTITYVQLPSQKYWVLFDFNLV